ncbi:MAG: hypothetical protein RLZZ165_157, partial [Bacteroidota bacterium]
KYLSHLGRTARTITLSEDEKHTLEVASNSRKAERRVPERSTIVPMLANGSPHHSHTFYRSIPPDMKANSKHDSPGCKAQEAVQAPKTLLE